MLSFNSDKIPSAFVSKLLFKIFALKLLSSATYKSAFSLNVIEVYSNGNFSSLSIFIIPYFPSLLAINVPTFVSSKLSYSGFIIISPVVFIAPYLPDFVNITAFS